MQTQLRCRGWRQEGLLRLLENVLTVGEDPDNLVVYAALGKAARDWKSHDAIVATLRTMEEGQTLLVQSGKPVALMRTHPQAPLVLLANCNLVGRWAREEVFYDLERRGLICWGGLTAGCWQYIGSQGVIQGTYEIFARIAEQLGIPNLAGRFVLTAGLGGMGGAQPLAARMAGAATLVVEVDPARIEKRLRGGFLEHVATSLDDALEHIERWRTEKRAASVAVCANAAAVYPELVARGITPDVVTDQTSAHDLVYGYIPIGWSPGLTRAEKAAAADRLMADSLTSIAAQVRAMLELKARGAVVFDNGNLIRSQAKRAGVANAFAIPIFTEAFLRPLFCRGIGPFRWIALSGVEADIRRIDAHLLATYGHNRSLSNWIRLAAQTVPFEGLPARIAWLGHGERSKLALEVNEMVRRGEVRGPIAFTRDHLDAGAMAHPNIMTENLKDGSDAVSDWPLLNALLNCASQADLVAIHSGGGGYAGYMTSAGVTLIADGTAAAASRLGVTLDNDTGLGVVRYADAGYAEALDEVARSQIPPGCDVTSGRPHYAGPRAILAASIGNALEWYDFSVYAFFAIYISRNVFVDSGGASALISAFLVYGVAFIARPVGAVLLGAYADRSGRRAALTVSLILMAAGSLCIAIAPPYAVIGIGAPMLILCGRLLQGLSAGGEIGGAVAFLVEHAPPERRGSYAAWLQSSMGVSNILGALTGVTLSAWLTPAQLEGWGWRIPFILGLSVAPVGLWLRASLEETPEFEAAQRARGAQPRHLLSSLRDVFVEQPRALAIAAGVSIIWVISVYTLLLYMPTYVQRNLGFSPSEAFTASLVGNVVMALGCVAAGRISDRIGRLLTVRSGTVLLLVATYPILAWVVRARTDVALFVGQTSFCAIVSVFTGSIPAVLAALFPPRMRSTGVSLTYNFAAVVFGGFAPAALTFLTESTHTLMAPAFYVVAAAAVSLAALAFVPRGAVE